MYSYYVQNKPSHTYNVEFLYLKESSKNNILNVSAQKKIWREALLLNLNSPSLCWNTKRAVQTLRLELIKAFDLIFIQKRYAVRLLVSNLRTNRFWKVLCKI